MFVAKIEVFFCKIYEWWLHKMDYSNQWAHNVWQWVTSERYRHVRTVQCTEFEKLIHSRVLDCWIIMSLGNRSIRSSNSISITKLRVDHSILIIFFTLSDFTSDVTMQCYNDLASIWWIWRSPCVISFMKIAAMIKIQSMTFLMDKRSNELECTSIFDNLLYWFLFYKT